MTEGSFVALIRFAERLWYVEGGAFCSGGGRMSVGNLPCVELTVGLLPPVGQERLLVISHPLKLSVRAFRAGGHHVFWADHVLKLKKVLTQKKFFFLIYGKV